MHPLNFEQPSPELLAIRWQDGTTSTVSTTVLRQHCPCTNCRSNAHLIPTNGRSLLTQSMTTIRELVLIGSRQLQIIWEDGHQWGLYSWEMLRTLADPPRRGG
ncbi:MAG: DUF971 domain-containing protein [Chlorobi bacterium CHB2]|nr:DUF971 domain-containing protein [Chlorobi bacterium CHB2]